MIPLSDETEFARVCLYGRYGTGKTTDIASGAHLGKVMHVDIEHRLKAGPLRRMGIPTENIEPFRDITADALGKLIWDVKARLHDGENIAAMGFDGFDEMIKILVKAVLDKNVSKSLERAARRGEVSDINPNQIDIDYWGEVTQQVRELLRHSRDLDCHLMFTSHERKDVDADDGTVKYGPASTPAIQSDLLSYVDIVGHTYLDGDNYVARFAAGSKYEAKDTFGVLPGIMVNPTLDRIVAYVREELTSDTDSQQIEYDAHRARVAERLTAAAVADEGARPRRRRSG